MNDNDTFSTSLHDIHTDKRVEKFQRFKGDFQRECLLALDNTQEWVKAELPMVTEYVDVTAVKDELKQTKISNRRKHLLSALLFEKNLRNSIDQDNASDAAVMALHMVNQIWQAKAELHGLEPIEITSHAPSNPAIQPVNETSEKILATLIEKGEKRKRESQIESQVRSKIMAKTQSAKKQSATDSQIINHTANQKLRNDIWDKDKLKASKDIPSSAYKKKRNGVLSKVKTKLPLKRKTKPKYKQNADNVVDEISASANDSLLDDPNRSSILVNPGFQERMSDSMVQARRGYGENPDESGITVRKVREKKQPEKKQPGMQTVVMKLASSAGRKPRGEMSIPEQCQDAINILSNQFPGYDKVAIRHMAAEKVGVSPQYIENLNILPE